MKKPNAILLLLFISRDFLQMLTLNLKTGSSFSVKSDEKCLFLIGHMLRILLFLFFYDNCIIRKEIIVNDRFRKRIPKELLKSARARYILAMKLELGN